jgi:hypothetical protein
MNNLTRPNGYNDQIGEDGKSSLPFSEHIKGVRNILIVSTTLYLVSYFIYQVTTLPPEWWIE